MTCWSIHSVRLFGRFLGIGHIGAATADPNRHVISGELDNIDFVLLRLIPAVE